MKHVSLLLSLAGLGALAACTTPPPLSTNCPNVAVLEQGSAMTEFLPGRQDVGAQIAAAKITGVAGSCTLIKTKKKNELKVTFQAGFAAVSGPANTQSTLVLPYLVSVSQGDTILSVLDRAIALKFDGNASTASATSKAVTVTLPNDENAATTDILVAFHLTPDQLAYNAAHPAP